MKMTSESLDELVFENRNKAYGAYVIRKEYAESLKIGLYVSSACVGIFVFCSFVMKTGEVIKDIVIPPTFDTGIVVIIDPPIIDPPPVEKLGGGPKNTSLTPVVTDDHVDTTQLTVQHVEGPVSTGLGPDTAQTGPSTSGPVGPEMEKPAVLVDPAILVPDEMPEMEGGWMKFLRKNLTYPDIAIENRTRGTVHISFVVERDGSVSNINVLKGIGDGCEEEAIRVVKKMKWKPGKNHGIPVRVQFTLPVKFTINE